MDKPVQRIGGWLLAAALIALAAWNQNRTAKEEDAKALATSTQAASRTGVSSDSTDSTTNDGRAQKNWKPVNGGYNTGPVIGQRTPVPQTIAAKTPTPVQLAKAATPSPATPTPQPDPKKAPFVPIGAKTDLDEGGLQPSKRLDMHHKK